MKKMVVTYAVAVASALMFSAGAFAAGQASAAKTAAKHPWASFKPGSWVKIKSTTNIETAGAKNTSVVESKITLLEKTADKVVLQTEVTVMGRTTTTKADFPLKANSDAVPPGVTVLSKGTDTVTLAGKTLACKTLESEINAGGNKIHSKAWTSEQVPGALVKSVTSTKNTQSTAEVVEFSAL